MIIFIDSADIDEIKEIAKLSIIDGVTTNPSLIAKTSKNTYSVIAEICEIIKGDVSAEVSSEDFDGMILEGKELFSISNNIVLKLPLTYEGIRVCKYFSDRNRKTNMTLCFSSQQALVAAKAGATYISPFIGRLDDTGQNGINLIRNIKTIFSNYPTIKTKILAASIRSQDHILQSALIGADAITMSGKLIKDLYFHALTDKGLEIFRKDSAKMV